MLKTGIQCRSCIHHAAYSCLCLEKGCKLQVTAMGPIESAPWTTPLFTLAVACTTLKGGRGNWLVEKATELGAFALLPILTERSHGSPRLGPGNSDRSSAARQAGVCLLLPGLLYVTWPKRETNVPFASESHRSAGSYTAQRGTSIHEANTPPTCFCSFNGFFMPSCTSSPW